MKNPKFSLNIKDPDLDALMAQADHKTLAAWAIACAERVMPCFEVACPDDPRRTSR